MKVGTYSLVSLWNVFDFSTKCSYPLSMESVHRKFNWICIFATMFQILCPRFKEKGGILFLLCTSILPSIYPKIFLFVILFSGITDDSHLHFYMQPPLVVPIYTTLTVFTPAQHLPSVYQLEFYFFKHYLLIWEMDLYISLG